MYTCAEMMAPGLSADSRNLPALCTSPRPRPYPSTTTATATADAGKDLRGMKSLRRSLRSANGNDNDRAKSNNVNSWVRGDALRLPTAVGQSAALNYYNTRSNPQRPRSSFSFPLRTSPSLPHHAKRCVAVPYRASPYPTPGAAENGPRERGGQVHVRLRRGAGHADRSVQEGS